MNEKCYLGGELELFAKAEHWKRYWAGQLRPFIRGDVLEVGAGLGTNTPLLRGASAGRWVCLEPDSRLVSAMRGRHAQCPLPSETILKTGTLDSLSDEDRFDTLLYVDVLEHIEDDQREIKAAAKHLRGEGKLIVLAPAQEWLLSPFDRAIGHYRRYTRGFLRSLTAPGLRVLRAFYLDSLGLLASGANRFMLRQAMPTARQLAFWDKFIVPCSRILDPLLGYSLGKTVVCVWVREA